VYWDRHPADTAPIVVPPAGWAGIDLLAPQPSGWVYPQITTGLRFPDLAASPQFERLVEMAVATIRRLAPLDSLHPDGGRNRKQWALCRDMLMRVC
jgi:hypothetical protein